LLNSLLLTATVVFVNNIAPNFHKIQEIPQFLHAELYHAPDICDNLHIDNMQIIWQIIKKYYFVPKKGMNI